MNEENIDVRKEYFRGSKEIIIEGQTYYVKSSGSPDNAMIMAVKGMISRNPSLKINRLEIRSQ